MLFAIQPVKDNDSCHLGSKDSLTLTSEIIFRLTLKFLQRRLTQDHDREVRKFNEDKSFKIGLQE